MIGLSDIASLRDGKYRGRHGLFLAEGPDVAECLLQCGYPARALLVTEEAGKRYAEMVRAAEGMKIPVERLAVSAFKKISATETPQGIALLAEIRGDSLPEKGPFVYLDCVQDPGNVGAVVRTAAASGFSAVIAGKGTADFFCPKAVRGSAGGIAAIACVADGTGEILRRLKRRGCRLVASDCREGRDFHDFPYAADMALIMGNEGEGITPAVLSLADERVRIPLQGEMKSLNVAVAFGILAFAAQSKIKEAP